MELSLFKHQTIQYKFKEFHQYKFLYLAEKWLIRLHKYKQNFMLNAHIEHTESHMKTFQL